MAVHRVAVDFEGMRPPIFIECGDTDEAYRCIEVAKRDPSARNIFYLEKSDPDSAWSTVRLALVRDASDGAWRLQSVSGRPPVLVIGDGDSKPDTPESAGP